MSCAPSGTVPQLTAWSDANRSQRWKPVRVVTETADGPIGAQVLVQRLRPGPWSRGYAARGPVAERYSRAALEAFTDELRREASRLRLTHVVVDPEIARGDPAGDALAVLGWQRQGHIQINQTRVVDLTLPEERLWGDLRSSARWSVNKSRRGGVTVEEAGPGALAEFTELYEETAGRVEAWNRMEYGEVFRAFHRRDAATLLLARDESGSAIAGLILLRCGPRIVERYGASSKAGLRARANYLVKWEAIRRCRERGFTLYDLWGTHEPGVAEFKSGFGGEERFYDGAFRLVTSRAGSFALGSVRRVRSYPRNHGRGGRSGPSGMDTVS